MVYEHILQAIGNTPIVKLNKVTRGVTANVYAKLEFMNPGGSIKDRIGGWLIDDFEKKGLLKPGGTIVEGTSGNTGVGLAIAAAIKGYKCIFVLPDKMSEEKIKNLRAFGARVVVTPTAVEPEDPRSYYSVSKRLAKETPNAVYIDQYNNLGNRDCHYRTTGPEILAQMPNIDVFIAGIGTGGTICGVARYLKEQKPSVQVIAVDPLGSLVLDAFKGKKVKAHTYKIEGIGEDFLPKNYDFSVITDMVRVEDKESFLMTRELLVKEGIYSGISSGAAVIGALKYIQSQGDALKGKNVLVILPDSGNRYPSKVYDDDWMREAGFLDEPGYGIVQDLVDYLQSDPNQIIMAPQSAKVGAIIDLMREKGISQVPVSDQQGWIKGIVTEGSILNALYRNQAKASDPVEKLVDPSIEFVGLKDSIEKISKLVTQGRIPLVVDPLNEGRVLAIITKIDLISFMGRVK